MRRGERLILAVSDGEVSSIWTAGADGGDRRLLVDWTADEVWPRLTDGSSLYYTCAVPGDTAAPGRTMLCRVPLNGGSAEELLELRDPRRRRQLGGTAGGLRPRRGNAVQHAGRRRPDARPSAPKK